jgi:hypothetical protein
MKQLHKLQRALRDRAGEVTALSEANAALRVRSATLDLMVQIQQEITSHKRSLGLATGSEEGAEFGVYTGMEAAAARVWEQAAPGGREAQAGSAPVDSAESRGGGGGGGRGDAGSSARGGGGGGTGSGSGGHGHGGGGGGDEGGGGSGPGDDGGGGNSGGSSRSAAFLSQLPHLERWGNVLGLERCVPTRLRPQQPTRCALYSPQDARRPPPGGGGRPPPACLA